MSRKLLVKMIIPACGTLLILGTALTYVMKKNSSPEHMLKSEPMVSAKSQDFEGQTPRAVDPQTSSKRIEISGEISGARDAASEPILSGRKARTKTLSEMSPSERGAHTSMLRNRKLHHGSQLRLAARAARIEAVCNKGDKTACSNLEEKSKTEYEALKAARSRLGKDCDSGDIDACMHRGDLDLLAGTHDNARLWLDKTEAQLTMARTACTESNPTACKRIERLERAFKNREKRYSGR
jgi:hypothetical protein